MTRTLTTSRRLAALGTALATGAALLVGGTAGAQTDTRIATQWVLDQDWLEVTGESYFELVDSAETPVLDSSALVTQEITGRSGTMREYALLADHFSGASLDDGGVRGSSRHEGPNTTITIESNLANGDGYAFTAMTAANFARVNGVLFGQSGEYRTTITYAGDARYRPSSLTDSATTTSDSVGLHTPVTIEAGTATNGQVPLTVRATDATANGGVLVNCAPFRSGTGGGFDLDRTGTMTSPGVFTLNCPETPGVPMLVSAMYAPDADFAGQRVSAAVAVIDPRTGGTTEGIDPATSLAPNQQIQVSATNLRPNHSYEVSLESTPRVVGTLITGADGAGITTITIPDDLASGHHHIVLRDSGTEVDRQPFTLSQRADPSRAVVFEVEGDVTPEPTTPTSPKPTTPKPTTPKPAPGGSGSLGGSSDMAGSIGS